MKAIVAVDDSTYSQEMVSEVARREWPRHTQFKILRVIEPVSWAELGKGRWADVAREAHTRRMHDAEQLCARFRELLQSHLPDARVHFEIREGSPKEQILFSAAEWQADKIMLGAHGRDICPRFALGSVSRSVARHAPCTVEIVRPKIHHRQHREPVQTAARRDSGEA